MFQVKNKLEQANQKIYEECLNYYSNLIQCAKKIVVEELLEKANNGHTSVGLTIIPKKNHIDVIYGGDNTHSYDLSKEDCVTPQVPKHYCGNMSYPHRKNLESAINSKVKKLYDIDIDVSMSVYNSLYFNAKW
ncbi:hypothetical protein Catovirus_1_476 [Catovirus CTV1]|uniref:Uncharacterized protein n=1 Tax=Catovirus CTV1 TaxID=1977631 RepID=A0A1V0S9N8_9VIRU|nr:hypothetical protein Catovirus_1_476 [Catovirus CTV1]